MPKVKLKRKTRGMLGSSERRGEKPRMMPGRSGTPVIDPEIGRAEKRETCARETGMDRRAGEEEPAEDAVRKGPRGTKKRKMTEVVVEVSGWREVVI